jgi:hypothetical protein
MVQADASNALLEQPVHEYTNCKENW